MIDVPAAITALASLVAAFGVILGAYWAYRAKDRAAAAARIASESQNEIIRVGTDVYELGKRVDGRLTELLDAAAAKGVTDAALARAEGKAEGEQKQRDRQAPAEHGGGQ